MKVVKLQSPYPDTHPDRDDTFRVENLVAIFLINENAIEDAKNDT